VNRVAVSRFDVRRGEYGAEKGAEACRAIQVDLWLHKGDVVGGPSLAIRKQMLTVVPRGDISRGWGKPRRLRKRVGRPMTWSAVKC
jgi:hypothetical protein